MSDKFLEELLADFETVEAETPHMVYVTLRLPAEAKRKYDRLQELSKRRFSKKLREAVLAFIEMAEKKAS